MPALHNNDVTAA